MGRPTVGSSWRFWLGESVDLVFDVRRVSLYLIVPPVLAFIVYFESYLSGIGATRIMSLGQRVMLALWNSTILLSLIAGLQGGAFFSRLFGSDWFRNRLALPSGRLPAFAWLVASYAALVTVFYLLTAFAILVAIPRPSDFSWLSAVINCYTPILWSVAASALFGLLARPGAASFMYLATAVMGSVAGLRQVAGRLPEWITAVLRTVFPRLGESFLENLGVEASAHVSLAVPVHGMVLLAAGAWLFLRRSRGRR